MSDAGPGDDAHPPLFGLLIESNRPPSPHTPLTPHFFEPNCCSCSAFDTCDSEMGFMSESRYRGSVQDPARRGDIVSDASSPGLKVLCAELSFRRYQSVLNARKTAI